MVTDINDETPKFFSDYYECEIAENAPLNTPLTFLGNTLPEVYDNDQVFEFVVVLNNLIQNFVGD